MAATTDLLTKVGLPGSATTLDSPGFTIGNTTINVGNTANWQTETLQCFAMDQVTIEAGKEVRVAGSYRELEGIVTSATSIGSVSFASGFSPRNYPAGSTTRVYIPVSSTRENKIVDWGKVEHNLNGTHKNITATTVSSSGAMTAGGTMTATGFIVSGSVTSAGWLPLGVAQSGTIVHNGNRSYDVPFASSVAAILSPGMRLLLDKTVAGNGYMGGALNGTNQYFTKASATGAIPALTDNFTIIAAVRPTAYVDGTIAACADTSLNNGKCIRMSSSGQIWGQVYNGGAGNYRYIATYASLPLNKTTIVAMTWASGTVNIYFDGQLVPVQSATVSGAAPTTAGTGGDIAVGRFGGFSGSSYFAGYVSNVAFFSSVLAAGTIRQYCTYKLTGAETNCIGAWSLDNTLVNQQAPGTNDLTAMNSAGFTAMSPHGQLGNGVEPSKAIGLVTAVNGSTVTVQVPEGVTIPTTGGITAVSYATSGVPFGWVSDKGRWKVAAIYNVLITQATGTSGTWYLIIPSGTAIKIPTGQWQYGFGGNFEQSSSVSGAQSAFAVLATATPTNAINKLQHRLGSGASGTWVQASGTYIDEVQLTAMTDFNFYCMSDTILTGSATRIRGDQGAVIVFAYPAGI